MDLTLQNFFSRGSSLFFKSRNCVRENMDEIQMIRNVKYIFYRVNKPRQSLLAITCTLDSMKDDFAIMEKSMDTIITITDSWKSMIQRT